MELKKTITVELPITLEAKNGFNNDIFVNFSKEIEDELKKISASFRTSRIGWVHEALMHYLWLEKERMEVKLIIRRDEEIEKIIENKGENFILMFKKEIDKLEKKLNINPGFLKVLIKNYLRDRNEP